MVYRPPLPVVLVTIALVVVVAMVAWVPHQRLLLTAMTDRTSYDRSEIVSVSVALAVAGNSPITIQNSCSRYDLEFHVVSDGGDTIYSSNYGEIRFCLQDGFSATLPAGWTESRSFSWGLVNNDGQPVPAGHTYTVLPVLGGSASVTPIVREAQVRVP